MAKDKNKKQKNDRDVSKVIIQEEELVIVTDGTETTNTTIDSQPQNTDNPNTDAVFGAPDLPSPNKAAILILIITAGILGLMYVSRQSIVAATVNGKPIYRYQMIKRLEKDFGKQAYENMLREELLSQEAKKRAIIVTQADIDKEFKKIDDNLKSQGTSLESALKQQNLTKADVTENVKFQILAAKLVSDKTKVTEDEIKQYMEQNKDFLPKDQSPQQVKTTVEDYIKQQKQAQAIDTLLNDLKGKAKINQIMQY